MATTALRTTASLLLILAASLAPIGCAKTSSVVLNSHPPREADAPIEVLSDFPSDRPYEELALLDAMGEQHTFADRTTAGVIELLQAEARKVGGDAIVVRSTERGSYNWGQGRWNRSRADAVAIRYTD